MEQTPCLNITNLTTLFKTRKGAIRAVNDLSLKVGKRELLGLVGESGCGKSVTLLSILRLIPYPGVGGVLAGAGWLVVLKMTAPSETKGLLDAAAYERALQG